MTNEKEPFEGDELVTETYRELGVEKAPERLNQSILRMAPGGGKPSPAGGILFAAWMKPLAFAATIGLSLAIVLELSQVPTVTVQTDNVPAAEVMREEAVLQNANVLEKAENRARLQSGPSRQLISEGDLGRSADTHDEVEAMVSDLFLLEQSDIADSCDAAVRLSRESWLTCIEELRQSGSEEAADREYEAFILDYSVESGDLEGNR